MFHSFIPRTDTKNCSSCVSCNIGLYGIQACCPSNFLRILKIGKEQAAIFIVTLIITLTNDLITGIFLGIATTFLIHVVLNKNLFLFTRNVFKPNVLMYLEEETGNYYVSVKNFCSFLNFFRLKSKLDEIPKTNMLF